jgi:hypothetical protein
MQAQRILRLFVVSALACALVTLTARPSSAGPDALTDKAAALYDDGMAAFGKGKLPEARASFLAAWSLKKHWQIAASLGDCEARLGLHRDAAAHLAFFLRAAPRERRTDAAQKLYDAARSKIGTLVITADVEGADIAVDGVVIGKAPLEDPVFVDPGRHVLEARDGARLARVQLDVLAGQRRDLTLKVTASDGGSRGPNKAVVIGGAAVSGAAVLTGAVLLGVSAVKGSTVNTLQDKVRAAGGCASTTATADCADLTSAGRGKATLGNAGLWTLVAGGTVGAATLVYGLVGGGAPSPTKSGLQVSPMVIGQGGGLLVTGTF